MKAPRTRHRVSALISMAAGLLTCVLLARIGLRSRGPLDGLMYIFAAMVVPFLVCVGVHDVLTARWIRVGPYCSGCGYLLRGLTVPRCPECGRAI